MQSAYAFEFISHEIERIDMLFFHFRFAFLVPHRLPHQRLSLGVGLGFAGEALL